MRYDSTSPELDLRKFAWLLVLLLAMAGVGRSQPAPLVLDGLGRVALPVDGVWQFHTGDDPGWASPGLDDSTWQPIEAGRSWEGQGHRDYTGFAWYRRRIVIPPGMPAGLDVAHRELALFLPGVDDAAEVYWNGKLVGSLGRVPPHPVWYSTPSPQSFVLGPMRDGVLAIRVWSAPIVYLNHPEQGGLYRTPLIGTPEGVAALETASRYEWLRSNQFGFGVCLVSTLVGLLAGFAWLRNRSRWMLFWLAFPMLKPLVGLVIFDLPGFSTFRLAYGTIAELVALYGRSHLVPAALPARPARTCAAGALDQDSLCGHAELDPGGHDHGAAGLDAAVSAPVPLF